MSSEKFPWPLNSMAAPESLDSLSGIHYPSVNDTLPEPAWGGFRCAVTNLVSTPRRAVRWPALGSLGVVSLSEGTTLGTAF